MAYWKHCDLGREPAGPNGCVVIDICARLPQGIDGGPNKRLCPVHDDTHASLSINVGTDGQRVVWKCHGGCAAEDVREGLLGAGIDERCLGDYGTAGRIVVPGLRVAGSSPGVIADAKRYQAILKLPGPDDINGMHYRMCIQAIVEGDGDLPGDPLRLLPVNRDDFLALAARTGIERSYRYRLYRLWLTSEAA